MSSPLRFYGGRGVTRALARPTPAGRRPGESVDSRLAHPPRHPKAPLLLPLAFVIPLGTTKLFVLAATLFVAVIAVDDGLKRPSTAPPVTSPTADSPETPPGASRELVLSRIAACESAGKAAAVSPDGRYRGKYQFDLPTWQTVGGQGDPALASEVEQDRRARMLLSSRGTQPWPACRQELGKGPP